MKQLLNIDNTILSKKTYFQSILVHLENKNDLKKFSQLINKKIKKNDNIFIERKTNVVKYYLGKNQEKSVDHLLDKNEINKWKKYWLEMPKYVQKDKWPYKSLLVHFLTEKGRNYFSEITDNIITEKTKYIYFPKREKDNLFDFKCISHPIKNPDYPMYIISKGRWESRLTAKALDKIKVPYHIVIEPQEYDSYASVINKKKIKILPFSNLGQGSIPARNWVWEDSIKRGFKRHWILDDNIRAFYRMNNNQLYKCMDGTLFFIIEQFINRFKNCGIAGMHYRYFFPKRTGKPPFYLNTRIYSNLLIDNYLPFRWRGKYNEDTDLSLRVLKNKKCTFLFNIFVCDKITTLVMKGGNTQELYGNTNNRAEFANSLVEQHPDLVKKVWRYNRWHHQVDYSGFKNLYPIYKKNIKLKNESNEYGMKLREKIYAKK